MCYREWLQAVHIDESAMEFQVSYYLSLGSCFLLSILYVSRWVVNDDSCSIIFYLSMCLWNDFSLYVWSAEENRWVLWNWTGLKQGVNLWCLCSRDHPTTIKKRFFSVFVVMLISPLFVYLCSSADLFKHFTIWEVMGLRTEGFLSALVIPLLLTMILFLGPLSVQLTNGIWKIYSGLFDVTRIVCRMHKLT